MKAYKLELLVIDFEGYGKDEIEMLAMNARGLDPTVVTIEEAEIGEWSDDHPLNKRDKWKQEYELLFRKE